MTFINILLASIAIYFLYKSRVFKATLVETTDNLKNTKTDLSKSETEVSNLKAQIDDLKIEIEKKSNSLKDLEHNLDQLDKKHKSSLAENGILRKSLKDIEDEKSKYSKKLEMLKDIEKAELQLNEIKQQIKISNEESNKIAAFLDSAKSMRTLFDVGFYHYKYKFEDVEKYREALIIVQEAQKAIIDSSTDFSCSVEELSGSPLIKSLRSLAIGYLNLEFEYLVERVSTANFNDCEEKAKTIFLKINKNLSPFNCSVSEVYLLAKLKELAISLEFEEEKQKIKDQQAELKRMLKEEEDARIEAEEMRDKAIEIEDEVSRQLEEAKKKFAQSAEDDKAALNKKIADLEKQLADASAEKERAISLAQITKTGHVYIISNIGSFGENIYKIGLTRREDPKERVKELGDASVPFSFDIHAFIRSDDAPKLENDLHNYFHDHRINKINTRKEFFKVPIESIGEACKKLGYEIQLTHFAEAREYRNTLELVKK